MGGDEGKSGLKTARLKYAIGVDARARGDEEKATVGWIACVPICTRPGKRVSDRVLAKKYAEEWSERGVER
jgi:hypothetical protein